MDLILTNSKWNDVEAIIEPNADFDIGVKNDFVITFKGIKEIEDGAVIYVPDSEFGGIIKTDKTVTSTNTIQYGGLSWRGILDKRIIVPPRNNDYKIVSGELNSIIAEIIDPMFDGKIIASKSDTDVSVTSYQFDRYCTVLEGLKKMLKTVGYRLKIIYIQCEKGEQGYVEVSAVPIEDFSETIELSQDSQMNFTFENINNGVNHLICLGKGELQERIIIDLYVQKDGSIGKTQYYKGIEEITETYDFSSAETDELEEKGIEKIKDLMNKQSFQMDITKLSIDVDIGDIVGGRDYRNNNYIKQPINEKILKINGRKTSLEYKLEGEK